jgi:hypothetical protein
MLVPSPVMSFNEPKKPAPAGCRRMVLVRLQHLGTGLWARDKKTKRIATPLVPSLELWSSKLTRAGRIVFEVAADWSELSKCWKEMLRLWVSSMLFSNPGKVTLVVRQPATGALG